MRIEYVVLVTCVAIWGSLHPVAKLTLREITGPQLALSRVLLGGAALLLFCLLSGRGRKLVEAARTGLGPALVLATTGFLGSSLLTMTALAYLPAAVNTLVSNLAPLFVALGGFLFLGEPVTRRALLGIVLGFAGVALLALGGAAGGPLTAQTLLGVLLGLVGSASWAVYTLYGRRAVAGRDPVAVTALATAIGSLQTGLVVGLTDGFNRLLAASTTTWLLLLWCGVAATGVAFAGWVWSLRRLQAARVAVFQYAIPPLAVLFAVVLLGEPITPPLVAALPLIVLAVALAQRT